MIISYKKLWKLLIDKNMNKGDLTKAFGEAVNVIFSKKNSVGKTTLLRLIMHSLGYSVPSTRGICFSDYETVLTIADSNNNNFVLTRNKDYIDVSYKCETKQSSHC